MTKITPHTKKYKHALINYIIKFLLIFCACYFGTLAVIGLAAPGGYYSSFVEHYLDYVSVLRKSLLYGAKILLAIFNYKTFVSDIYYLRSPSGNGVHLGFDCLGYGVMSFWIAFVAANAGSWQKKIQWIFMGLILIWLINIVRISLLLVANSKHWIIPVFDHHTWFNIASYLLIFMLIYFYQYINKNKKSMTETYE